MVRVESALSSYSSQVSGFSTGCDSKYRLGELIYGNLEKHALIRIFVDSESL